jgi:hypothetical protein
MEELFQELFEECFFGTFTCLVVAKKIPKRTASRQVFGHDRGFYVEKTGKMRRIKLSEAIKMAYLVGLPFKEMLNLVDGKLFNHEYPPPQWWKMLDEAEVKELPPIPAP